MPASPKPARTVNTPLIQEILEEQGCCLIGLDGNYENCFGNDRLPHHIKTRGSGGGDERGNILRVCLHHHQMCHNGLIPKRVQYQLIERYTVKDGS